MKVRDFTVRQIPFRTCRDFCKVWHYSGGCAPGKFYFGLFRGAELIGVICYGDPTGRGQKKCYNVDIELRRLCCIDDTPKNTESFFIGKTLRELKKLGIRRILSLADPEYGHNGTIYKASNFILFGEQKGNGRECVIINGVRMHPRTVYAKYGTSGYKKLTKILPNSVIEIQRMKKKLVYIYDWGVV